MAQTQSQSRLADLEARFAAVEGQLADPLLASDQKRMAALGREHTELGETLAVARKLVDAEERAAAARELLKTERDPEMRELAEMEVEECAELAEVLSQDLQMRLIPRDPLDDRDVMLEIRAGTGGDEAGLFAADLLRMYSRYAERIGWRVEIVSATEGELGGFREVVAEVRGEKAYSVLKHEAGVHRVQRVPVTEAQGRIHTSAATVAVLPEAEEAEVEIRDGDLRVDTFCSSGAGGQHVNRTESAVRITHLPTGLVVSCQDERSQHKNRAKAMGVLRARLLERQIAEAAAARSGERKSMVGGGDRSERIRTYNFPQNRLTDHRINKTLYSLDRVMMGDLDEMFRSLKQAELEERLAALAK